MKGSDVRIPGYFFIYGYPKIRIADHPDIRLTSLPKAVLNYHIRSNQRGPKGTSGIRNSLNGSCCKTGLAVP
uniref:Uncharacterized protein n=1 Tax=Romanomermis culicivorax TaxID=13658 RepID=A0A915J575_ROMCU